MRLKSLVYFFGFIISTLFTSQAMEQPDKLSPEALSELNQIVCTGFPLHQYDENERFAISEVESKFKSTNVFQILDASVVQVFHILSPRYFLNLGETCHYLRAVSLSPCFHLNNYCLQPGILRSMPTESILSKAKRSKDGIIQLTSSIDATPKRLGEWFEKPELQAAFDQYGQLPETLVGLSQAQIEGLYPVIKLGLAIDLANPTISQLIPISRNIPQNSPEYAPCFRLEMYYSALLSGQSITYEDFWNLQQRMELGVILYNPLIINVLIHDFLIFPGTMCYTHGYFMDHPNKADTAIRLLQWQSKNSVNLNAIQGSVSLALELNRPDVAFNIADKFLEVTEDHPDPYPQNTIASKASIFIQLEKDTRLQEAMNRFAKQLQGHWEGDHWNLQLEGYTKQHILRIFLRTGHLDDLSEQLADCPTQDGYPDDELIEDSFNFGQIELGCKVIQRNFAGDSKSRLPGIYNFSQFIRRILQTDRETFLPLLKARIEAAYSIERQASFLASLASSSRDPDDIEYVTSQAAFLIQKLADTPEVDESLYFDLARIYLDLGNKELMEVFYNQWVQEHMKKPPIRQARELSALNKKGLMLKDLSDLVSMDPSEILLKVWQAG